VLFSVWEDYHNFYLVSWVLFALWEAYSIFTILREGTHSTDHNLNITDDNMGLIKSFSASTELHNMYGKLKFCF
jgi:hypothetical protein